MLSVGWKGKRKWIASGDKRQEFVDNAGKNDDRSKLQKNNTFNMWFSAYTITRITVSPHTRNWACCKWLSLLRRWIRYDIPFPRHRRDVLQLVLLASSSFQRVSLSSIPKAKSFPEPQIPTGLHWSLFFRHQLTLKDHGYGTRALQDVLVYSPAFAGTHF